MQARGPRVRPKTRRRSRSRQVVLCTKVREPAQVARRQQLSTRTYPEDARARLGEAVERARTAAGHPTRETFAAKAKISVRNLIYLEQADRPIGQKTLFAVASALPGWTDDTPRIILEGGPIPEPREPVVRPLNLIEQRLIQVYVLLRQMGLTKADAKRLAFQVGRQLELDEAVYAAIEKQPVSID